MTSQNKTDQNRTPIFEAVKKYIDDKVIPFHVPGHKGGKGIAHGFKDYVGEQIFRMDVNGMEDLDNICNPVGVIKEAENLLARLYNADESFMLVNGTTQGVQAMILYACRPGEEIIIPRNAHRSTLGALILSGAIPVYIQPEIHVDLGISTGLDIRKVRDIIKSHPYAKTVFVNNPTYYGMVSDLKEIVKAAHDENMLVLADEAHGAHFPFHPALPATAMELGADMSAISLHKTGGSMTQSSALLIKRKNVCSNKVNTVVNLMQTTSASYILMVSLDLARKHLALRGKSIMTKVIGLAGYARQRINNIIGLYAFGPELSGQIGIFAFDDTKLCINVRGLGLSGYEVESILRKEYNIQVEMSDFYNILSIISLGDNMENIDSLIDSLKDISQKYSTKTSAKPIITLPTLSMITTPREAFYANKKKVLLEESAGEISGETAMAYPPGIPALCPGERISKDMVDYLKMMKASKYQLLGMEDPHLEYINVLS
ncbi:MAG: aminotransferase class I/II-fold pyridoxal phosphate-dependent enzyme [Clostridiales bacterium]|nr:aminotransferase class I/II-fold pyridoxal phosphate-dependent enzyme [Clostridiales bacterium]